MRELGSEFRVEGLGLSTDHGILPNTICEVAYLDLVKTYAPIIQAMVPHACFAGALEAVF